MLTRSVKIQLGLAVPGVSGRKKYAAMATGIEMTPLMTTSISGCQRVSDTANIPKSHRHPARPARPLRLL